MPSESRERQVKRVLDRITSLILDGQRKSSTFTRGRLILFLTALACTVTLYKLSLFQAGNWSLAAFVAIFLTVASYHNRLESRIHRLRLWKSVKAAHLARVRMDWAAIPRRTGEPQEPHPYANDLDLIGLHSLTHLVDTTVSDQGRERLHMWLLRQPSTPFAWKARRELIKSLVPRSLFRDRLVLEAHLAGEQEINGRRLAAVLEHQVGFPRLNLILAIQGILALSTATLGISALLNLLPGYWIFSFGTYVVVYFMTDRGEELLEHAVGLHHEMERLGTVLRHLERHARVKTSPMAIACAPLMQSTAKPSLHVKRAARILHAISVKAHPLVHLIINALCPWDLWFTRRLIRTQEEITDHLPIWLDCLAEVEAASALATFAHLHPDYAWPTPLASTGKQNGADVSYIARGLGHPLIPVTQRVLNDLAMDGTGTVVLVTGSNMSGKSTFLRTVGINLCLAQAGAPVCASHFEWTWSRLACCIRIDDSLDAGLSFFYAEVKRLKMILDASQEYTAPSLLFLIDEIFKGTNNRERLIGSRTYIRTLATGNGLGLVTTHDLELTDLDKEIPSLTNAHFQETVSSGCLQFDYKLRPGPCPTTNALRIMELEGLPVPPPQA